MTITDQYILDLKLQADHCGDYSQYKREMDHIDRLKAKRNGGRASVQGSSRKAERRPTGRRTATSVDNAITMMEQHLGKA